MAGRMSVPAPSDMAASSIRSGHHGTPREAAQSEPPVIATEEANVAKRSSLRHLMFSTAQRQCRHGPGATEGRITDTVAPPTLADSAGTVALCVAGHRDRGARRINAGSGYEGAAVPRRHGAPVPSSLHGQMKNAGADPRRKSGENQHSFHHEELVAIERPGFLGRGMQEQDSAAEVLPLTANEERPALIGNVRNGLRRGGHQHGGQSTVGQTAGPAKETGAWRRRRLSPGRPAPEGAASAPSPLLESKARR